MIENYTENLIWRLKAIRNSNLKLIRLRSFFFLLRGSTLQSVARIWHYLDRVITDNEKYDRNSKEHRTIEINNFLKGSLGIKELKINVIDESLTTM